MDIEYGETNTVTPHAKHETNDSLVLRTITWVAMAAICMLSSKYILVTLNWRRYRQCDG